MLYNHNLFGITECSHVWDAAKEEGLPNLQLKCFSYVKEEVITCWTPGSTRTNLYVEFLRFDEEVNDLFDSGGLLLVARG